MTFDNDDLANKFVESLNSAGVSCTKNGNKDAKIPYIIDRLFHVPWSVKIVVHF